MKIYAYDFTMISDTHQILIIGQYNVGNLTRHSNRYLIPTFICVYIIRFTSKRIYIQPIDVYFISTWLRCAFALRSLCFLDCWHIVLHLAFKQLSRKADQTLGERTNRYIQFQNLVADAFIELSFPEYARVRDQIALRFRDRFSQ